MRGDEKKRAGEENNAGGEEVRGEEQCIQWCSFTVT